MITRLFIRNLVLIEQVTVHFSRGLNILSGETGSGKSALLSALQLIVGKRFDASLVRKGTEKAIVEAVFDIDDLPLVKHLLEEGGIAFAEGDELIITRELPVNGKGRIFVNNQSVPTQFLKVIGEQLLSIVSQHANQDLFSLDYHRQSLDLMGGLQKQAELFAAEWALEKELIAELEALRTSEASRLQTLQRSQAAFEEIKEAALVDGEEEELFAEYTRLIHVEDISKYAYEISHVLNGDEGVLNQLKGLKRTFDKLLSLDSHFQESSDLFQSATRELQELSFAVEKSAGQTFCDPERLSQINERLTLLSQLKKKYGDSCLAYQSELKAKIDELERADLQLEEFEKQLPLQQAKTDKIAKELTRLRTEAALDMQELMTEQLRQLNMPKASFTVSLTPQKRSSGGDDLVEWFLAPNVGERPVALRDSASGGEISRVMLALQALLGKKEQTPTLLFDEIDANIGGETATVVGEKLKEIAKAHQVLCVTHFPQVARQADSHFRIRKEEMNERTLTLVDELDVAEREIELKRMLGFIPSASKS